MIKKGLALAALVLAFQGCASTAPVRVTYEPAAPAQPLDAASRPKLFLDKVEDQTGGVDLYTNQQGHVRLPFTSSFDYTLRQALRLEFSRLDAPLVETAAQADAVLNARAGEAETADGGSLMLTLTVVGRDGGLIWSKRLKGRGKGGDNDAAVSGALADALSRLGPALESDKVAAKISAAPTAAGAAAVVSSDIDELPASAARPRPNAHAVVVGVRNYRRQLPEAEFADADARLVAKYLTRTLGFQEENVATLINEQASKSDFEKYFERWLPNRVEKGDEVWIYFSGNGAPNPSTGESYLVPYDGDPAYLQQTGYPLTRLWAALEKLPAGKITVVMDSGFSGAGGRSILAKGARPLVTVSLGAAPASVDVLTAAAPNQAVQTYAQKGHGLFTYFLLKGLKSETNLKSVFDGAAAQVAKVARKDENSDQTPQWKRSGQ